MGLRARTNPVRCLICNKNLPQPAKTPSVKVREIYSDLMEVLCKYMKWNSPSKYRFDFKKENFPFCKECVLFVVKLYKSHEKLEETHAEINKVIIGISGKLLLSPRFGKKQGKKRVSKKILNGKNSSRIMKNAIETEEKYKYYRNQIYTRFTPSVRLSVQKWETPTPNIWNDYSDYDSEVLMEPLPVEVKLVEEHDSISATHDYEYNSLMMTYEDQMLNLNEILPSTNSSYLSDNDLFPGIANPFWGVTDIENEQESNLLQYSISGTSDKNLQGHECNANNPALEQQFLRSFTPLESEVDPFTLSPKKAIDSSSKLNACKTCGKKFTTQSSLQKHQFTHTDDRPFSCDLCGKSFKKPRYLRIHKANVHIRSRSKHKKILCDVCGQTFKRLRLLTAHSKTHEKMSCLICGQNVMKSLFETHMLTHSTGESFKCVDCNKSFNSSWELHFHLKNHGNKSSLHVCDICGKTFAYNFTLTRHKRSVHNCTILSKKSKKEIKTTPDSFQSDDGRVVIQARQYSSSPNNKQNSDEINSEASEEVIYCSNYNFQCPQCLESFASYSGLYHHSQAHAKSK